MFKEILQKPQALFWAIVLHVGIVLLLVISFRIADPPDKGNQTVQVTTIPSTTQEPDSIPPPPATIDQIARQTPSFRSGSIARVAKPPYVRSFCRIIRAV